MSESLRKKEYPSGLILEIVQGDITKQQVDAIVNAANQQLQHGGGVAGVISKAGGPVIQQESNRWIADHGPITHNAPAYTSAGSLPCRYVIHAVGPVWGSGEEDQKLRAAVAGSLELASELQLSSLALPALSTGIFGFPEQRAARVILTTCQKYGEQHPHSPLELVRVVVYGSQAADVFSQTWDQL